MLIYKKADMKNSTAFSAPFILFLLFVPFFAGAQKDVSGIPIPMKKGILFYEKSYTPGGGASGIKDQDLYKKAVEWFAQIFPGGNKQVKDGDYSQTNLITQSTGSITCKETFKVLTGDTSVNYYYITVTMHVDIKDGGYTFQIYNFYEKPVQKGISNDYSKIEYRWWDFRQGKPWFNTDKALFSGLNEQTLAYMDSFRDSLGFNVL
jgi:hypothetical protein